MSKLEIINGKLYRDGVYERLKSGNPEHIKCFRESEAEFESFEKGVVVEPEYETQITASISFKCICGGYVFAEAYAESECDVSCFNDRKIKCRKCEKQYEISEDGEELIAKLIINKSSEKIQFAKENNSK